ncbi:MAG TPA: acyl-CoA reductase [Thermoanaerobaculia bacterium]
MAWLIIASVLADFALPPGVLPAACSVGASSPELPAPISRAAWTPASLAMLAAALRRGGEGLRTLPNAALLDAWAATVEAFLDPGTPERQALAPPLATLCCLSPAALDAGLEAVLGGVRRGPAAALLERAAALSKSHSGGERREAMGARSEGARSGNIAGAADGSARVRGTMAAGQRSDPDRSAPVLVVLSSNLPALAVQPLLPALALRRPVLLKSPSSEPLFAPAFLAALTRREPRLAGAVAAATWPGGDAELEAPLLAASGAVVAYGGAEALADLARRAAGKRFVGYGPKMSLAAVELGSGGTAPEALAAGLARDVALFDQRGCLSVAAVYVAGGLDDAARLAGHLEAALAALAARWPPGPAVAPALAAVQQLRLEAELRGLPRASLPPAAGTVLLEPEPALCSSPGLRTVRVHPLPDLDRLPEILAPWRGRLQGAALAGPAAWRLAPRLAALGISRCAAPGDLQSPDAAWHNGGIDPLAALALAESWG